MPAATESIETEPSDEPAALEEKGLPREVYALLAHANLLRMRGGWDAAVQNCMAALQLAPNSSSAQSLLGDIYENQGRYDDAIQWYRMALDISPDSSADKIKLNRLLDLQKQPSSRSRQPQSAAETPQSTASQIINMSNTALQSDKALRLVSVIAAVLLLLIVSFAYVSIHRHASLAALGLTSDQEVKTPMVVLPPSSSVNTAGQTDDGAHDVAESGLLEALRASQDLKSQGITIWNVQSDPRSEAIGITCGLISPAEGSISRESILRAAYLTAHAASTVPFVQTSAKLTIRCLKSTSGVSGTTSLIFVGDIPQSSLSSEMTPDAENDEAQLESKFTNIWWSPQVLN